MVSADWCRLMARYNAWQNRSLVGAADGLSDADRRADRGAFFASISGTLNHLLWGDLVWMSRLGGWPKPDGGIAGSAGICAGWEDYKARRTEADDGIGRWADALGDGDLGGGLSWHSEAAGGRVDRPKWICVGHFFNHQAHHRGQVHAMLTAAGARPGDTDLALLPEGA